jgi:hypothetical protein
VCAAAASASGKVLASVGFNFPSSMSLDTCSALHRLTEIYYRSLSMSPGMHMHMHMHMHVHVHVHHPAAAPPS